MDNNANTGRVVVCPVVPGEPLPFDDSAADVGITVPVSGTVLPELVAWMPTSGLSHRLGAVLPEAWQRADQLRVVERQLQRDHAAAGVREHPGPLDPEAAQQLRALGGVVGHRQRLGGCGVRVPGAGDADPAQAGGGRLALERDEPVGEDCCVDQDKRLAQALLGATAARAPDEES